MTAILFKFVVLFLHFLSGVRKVFLLASEISVMANDKSKVDNDIKYKGHNFQKSLKQRMKKDMQIPTL